MLILKHNCYQVLFDKIASVYLKKIYLYFSSKKGQPREPALCQLYRHTFVPYSACRNSACPPHSCPSDFSPATQRAAQWTLRSQERVCSFCDYVFFAVFRPVYRVRLLGNWTDRDTFTLEVPVVIRLTCDCAVADDAVMPIHAESSSWWGSGVN